LKSLKTIAMELKLSGTLTKRLLFNRIRDSGHIDVAKLGDDEFELRRVVDPAGKKKEAWMVLTPKVVPPIPGVNLATGAQVGFYGPTNRENAVGGTRSNFLTKEKTVRPHFVKKGVKKKSRPTTPPSQGSPRLRARRVQDPVAATAAVMDDGPTAMTAATTPRTPNLAEGEEDEEDDNDLGGPSPHCRKLIPKLRFARPKDFFDTQLTPTYMAWLVKATNSRAVADEAGVGT
jgi:hypothetical protein